MNCSMLNVKEDFRSLEFLNVFNWEATDLFDLLLRPKSCRLRSGRKAQLGAKSDKEKMDKTCLDYLNYLYMVLCFLTRVHRDPC